MDISFPEIEKFDRLPEPRAEGPSAFVSIMEGCSKYCSFCVVPYTRGEEVSRPFEDVLVEVAQLAAQGVREINLLGQNVNAYRGAYGADAGDAAQYADLGLLIRTIAQIEGIGHHPLHHLASAGVFRFAGGCLPRCAAAGQLPAPAGAGGQRPHSVGDEARLHRAGIQIQDPQAACSAPDISISSDFIVGFPAKPKPTSKRP